MEGVSELRLPMTCKVIEVFKLIHFALKHLVCTHMLFATIVWVIQFRLADGYQVVKEGRTSLPSVPGLVFI